MFLSGYVCNIMVLVSDNTKVIGQRMLLIFATLAVVVIQHY